VNDANTCGDQPRLLTARSFSALAVIAKPSRW